jgi:hypothetical protein
MGTDAIRIYLAYLRDKKRIAENNSSAFVSHWLSFEEFTELERLVLAQCDLLDAQTYNIRDSDPPVCLNYEIEEEEVITTNDKPNHKLD